MTNIKNITIATILNTSFTFCITYDLRTVVIRTICTVYQ